MDTLLTSENLMSLVTLTALEIVLGIDNIVFLSILAGKLPAAQQEKARKLGLALALFMRLGLLFCISWVMGLTAPLFSVLGKEFSGQKLILLIGGLFLIAKSTHEIYDKMEVSHAGEQSGRRAAASFGWVLVQILALDLVFSLDSVITAVGMAKYLSIMATAMVISVGVMLVFAGSISDFVNRHPSMKILALSFLLLIGVMLVGESLGEHLPKGYIYFAMAFSLSVELLNIKIRRGQAAPVKLHDAFETAA